MRGLGVSVLLAAALLAGCAADGDDVAGDALASEDPRPVEDSVLGFSWTVRPASGEARPPTKPYGNLDPTTLEWLVDSELRPGAGDLAVVGAFASPEEAARALPKVRRRLPAGTGRHAGTMEAVVRLGPLVVVRGLGATWQARGAEELLADVGADGVLLEERAGSPGFVADLSCEPTRIDDSAAAARDLIDFSLSITRSLRPPWVEPGLTDEERVARSTLFRAHRARVELMQTDQVVDAVAEVYLASLRNNRVAEDRARGRLDQLLIDQAPTELDEPYDERVLALYRQALADSSLDVADFVTREIEPMLGQLPEGSTFDSGRVQAARLDERLDIAGFQTSAFVPGLARLLMLLERIDCDDVTIALIPR